jgi:hypothetical protein
MKTLLLSLILATASLTAHACGGYGDEDHFFAHEWGTFTSIQGTDGVPIAWQSLIEGDLPGFVYNRTRAADAHLLGAPLSPFTKGAIAAPQRIETPVIYFYSLKPRTVDVRVDLPLGTITEWYPQIRKFGPALGQTLTPFIDPQQRNKSFIEWTKVQIVPDSKAKFLDEKRPSHYYAARDTDATPVRVIPPTTQVIKASGEGLPKPQDEKFLFYRGVAHFPSPLFAKATGEHSLTLRNPLDWPLQHVFIIDQRAGEYAFNYHAGLAAGEEFAIDLKNTSASNQTTKGKEQLIQAMRKSLAAAGLFEKEAAAMVKTWEDSWFDEAGLRVLYVLPEQWVNDTMPLKLSPAPTQIARVFVGRADLFTPGLEQTLAQLINKYSQSDTAQKNELARAVRGLRLGRFTQAAFSRVTAMTKDKDFHQAAYQLQSQSTKTETKVTSSSLLPFDYSWTSSITQPASASFAESCLTSPAAKP